MNAGGSWTRLATAAGFDNGSRVALSDLTPDECREGFVLGSDRRDEFEVAYWEVVAFLNSQTEGISRDIVEADPVGLSAGVGDFIADVWWALLLVLAVVGAPYIVSRYRASSDR
jgi:hypothetical protein